MSGQTLEEKMKISRSNRLEARVDREQKALFERAAALQGCSLSAFLIASAREAAIKTIREHEIIALSGSDQELFIQALLAPPKPIKKMRQAVSRYKKEMGV